MAKNQVFPTKGNLLAFKKTDQLAKLGYDLIDRKRNILIREMMQLIESVRQMRTEITDIFQTAYIALQEANITLGIVSDLAKSVPIDDGLSITYRSVMGVDIPSLSYDKKPVRLNYGIASTNTKFDYAYQNFIKVRDLVIKLAEIDNSAYRLAFAIRKAQKRANALKNIVIPELQENIKFIADSLEEKEREEFSRLKMIKNEKNR
ncbi:MAG TPA: V-type ATP synthase subunit D [Bacillota bacterium]|nr:V-type ATP synthase subunit D [Bacillota bacterium]HPF42204.1 V-type ATP synthase subunit D [Bacillota bacterium]HPQ61759.1 V-type ATP synthase subunit D [Bacillota bacterium]HRX91255.1 V-type ATP synthase subunit D [Candidatus Izemoplasmatales bacterium]